MAGLGGLAGCRDLSSFSNHGDHFEGGVVAADFVRTGVDAGTTMCLTLDADHLQDGPGHVSTSDGRFTSVPLRPIPQVWHDPLSTLSFGDGRPKSLLYQSAATAPFGDGEGSDVLTVVSLMQSGDVEVRFVRSAPGLSPEGGTGAAAVSPVFAVFALSRKAGACSF